MLTGCTGKTYTDKNIYTTSAKTPMREISCYCFSRATTEIELAKCHQPAKTELKAPINLVVYRFFIA